MLLLLIVCTKYTVHAMHISLRDPTLLKVENVIFSSEKETVEFCLDREINFFSLLNGVSVPEKKENIYKYTVNMRFFLHEALAKNKNFADLSFNYTDIVYQKDGSNDGNSEYYPLWIRKLLYFHSEYSFVLFEHDNRLLNSQTDIDQQTIKSLKSPILQERIGSLVQSIKTQKTLIDKNKDRIANLEKQNKTLQELNARNGTTLVVKEEQITKYKKSDEDNKKKISSLNKELEKLKNASIPEEHVKAEVIKKDLRLEYNMRYDAWEKEKKRKDQEIRKLTQENEKKQNEITRINEELKSLKFMHQELSSENEVLQQKLDLAISVQSDDRQVLFTKLASQEDLINALNKDNAILNSSLEELKTKLASIKQLQTAQDLQIVKELQKNILFIHIKCINKKKTQIENAGQKLPDSLLYEFEAINEIFNSDKECSNQEIEKSIKRSLNLIELIHNELKSIINDELQKKIAELSKLKAETDEKIQEQQQLIDRLNKNIVSLDTDKKALITELSDQKTSFNKNIEELRQKLILFEQEKNANYINTDKLSNDIFPDNLKNNYTPNSQLNKSWIYRHFVDSQNKWSKKKYCFVGIASFLAFFVLIHYVAKSKDTIFWVEQCIANKLYGMVD